jgi:tripartite ATP-independent transporter DctP family solute receptor
MRTRLAGVIALILLAAVAANVAAQPRYVLRFSSPNSKEHAWGRGAEKFRQLVAEETNGQVDVQIYHSNALGATRESLEMVRLGSTDFVLSGVAHVTRFVPELGAFVLPYLWKDTETMFKALDGRMGEVVEPLLYEKGFKLIGWWDNGFRHISNNRRPIHAAEDIKGLKLRSLPAKIHVTFWRALGASPTPMDWAEVYPALQQGVVDGQENPPGIVFFEKLPDVQKYYSLTKHVNEPGNVLMSRAVWDKLPADIQKAITSAARKATAFERAESQRDNDELLRKLAGAGMKVNTVADDKIAALRKIAHGLYGQALADLGPKGKELVDAGIALNK